MADHPGSHASSDTWFRSYRTTWDAFRCVPSLSDEGATVEGLSTQTNGSIASPTRIRNGAPHYCEDFAACSHRPSMASHALTVRALISTRPASAEGSA